MKQLKTGIYSVTFLIVVAMASCSKMDSGYAGFIKDGPIIYPGKADSLKAFAGKGRIRLRWLLTSDKTLTTCKVFWNFGGDSLVIPVTKGAGVDTITAYINNLYEGSYNFIVYTYDKSGHRSVGTEIIGYAYGDLFQSIIANRPIRSSKKEAALSKVTVIWVGRDAQCLGTEWKYTGTDQQPKQFYSPIGDTTFITSCNVNNPVSYRSLFVPEPNAIDTFYTDYKSL
jgi:hypothetical protein